MRYITILSFLLLLISCKNIMAQKDTVFFDGFSDNSKNWSLMNTDINKSSIEDGYYKWEHKTDGDWNIFYNVPNMNPEKDFSFEASFLAESGGAYGLIWGAKDASNGFHFIVNTKGEFEVYLNRDGNISSIKDFTKSQEVKSDKNTLSVNKKGDQVIYLINGQKVYQDSYDKLFGRKFGITAIDKVKISIDYIMVKQDINLIPGLVYESEPENLGDVVNSEYPDLNPIVTPDGKGLYFTRKHSPDNIGGTNDGGDIYYSQLKDGKWQQAKNVGKPLNNKSPNGVCSVTPDGNTILLRNKYTSEGEGNGVGLSMSYRTEDGWTVPENVNITDYYNNNNFSEFCMSDNRQIILMTVQRDDSYGEKDIYVSMNQGSGKWSRPKNIGPVINTPYEETGPFLSSDGVTLFFSSNGHSGYGNNDIFMTRRLDDSWTKWSEPQNIGRPINTDKWDAYYSLSASGEYAYFVSSRAGGFGKDDIYRIKLPKKAKPEPVVLVMGRVLNAKTNQPVKGTISYYYLADNKLVGIASANPADGSYKITLPAGKKYGFLAAAENFISINENLDLTSLTEYKEVQKDLYLAPIEIGQAVRLNNIFFQTAKWELLPESLFELDRLAKILTDNPGLEIEIDGHTDNVGNDQNNLILSQNRAKSVLNYLVLKNIKVTRLSSNGFGKSMPVAGNDTDEGRQLNRRVEFVILKK